MKFIKTESGRSMIEMLGVLAIMAVLTVGAIQLVNYAMKTQKKGTVEQEITQITTGIRGLNLTSFESIDNGVFSALGMSQKNPYDGNYEVEANPSDSSQFIIKITGLAKSECEYFKLKRWTESAGYIDSEGKESGATAEPANCDDTNGDNTISIRFKRI